MSEIRVCCNVDDDTLIGNIKTNSARAIPCLGMAEPRNGEWAVLVGGGPSMADHYDEVKIRQAAGHTVFAINGAAKALSEHGIVPDWHFLLDARPHNIKFVNGNHRPKAYLVSSQCAPAIFDALTMCDVTMFHPFIDGIEEFLPPEQLTMVGGGTTSGLTLMAAAFVMGFRNIALYGYDSSEAKGKIHAYDQEETEQESRRIQASLDDGQVFNTSLVMYKQAELFPDFVNGLADLGVVVTVHGTGLIPAIAHKMQQEITAEEAA